MQLVQVPRKVGRINISYARASKQVLLMSSRFATCTCSGSYVSTAIQSAQYQGALATALCSWALQGSQELLQVDVRALKEDLWSSLQELDPSSSVSPDSDDDSPTPSASLSFQDAISRVDTGTAAETGDVSVHLCFICLLHLANEHGLQILGTPQLDDMSVMLPSQQL